jgi:glycosyltransferase involved in cell wall biosynthesis
MLLDVRNSMGKFSSDIIRRKKIDVSIATYNSEKTIKKCIKCVISSIPYRRIVIVDGGSTDRTLQIVKSMRIRNIKIIKEKGYLGLARVRQAKETRGKWIVLIDSDTFVYKNWFKEMVKYINEDVGMIVGNLKVKYPIFFKTLIKYALKPYGVSFSNTLVRRNLLLECPHLEKIHIGEDVAVYKHLLKKGLKCVFVSKVIGEHEPITSRGLRKRLIREGYDMKIRYGMSGALFKNLSTTLGSFLIFLIYLRKRKKVPFTQDLRIFIFLFIESPLFRLIGTFKTKKI